MPTITLPDGNTRSYNQALSAYDVAHDISPGLARRAVAARIDGELKDIQTTIDTDRQLAIVTDSDEEGIDVIRHSTAHLLAHAVKTLFPDAQVTIGPVIEEGFFYDFSFERAFTPEDILAIEKKMKEIAKQALPVTRSVVAREEAIKRFADMGESYKAEIIRDLPDDEVISIYEQGDFQDLCRGPHVPNTKLLKAFKLTKLAGAYWRGDSNNEMLQRVYGTAWANKKDLNEYLENIAEAEKRDHRKLGKQLGLFHIQPEAPGMIFWHPKGWSIYRSIKNYIRERLTAADYKEIQTPQVIERTLWEKSGHWDKYAENMFTTGSEDRVFAIKPMNCPCHVQVFNQRLHSYKELPIRLAEFGSCHRNEASGTLHGLMRVRGFTQDDAHIFCTQDQIQSEVLNFIDLLRSVYEDFGFSDVQVSLSTRPEKRVGDDALWDKAEVALEQALKESGLEWTLEAGEGAFYGPKIDFSLRDSLKRVWQLGTVQLDFSMPGRLGASYIDEAGDKQVPVMLHRAILGSLERFIGVLIEHYAGILPLWLAPVQVVALNIADRHADYVKEVEEILKKQGFRVESDLRNEKIGFKIREHTLQRVPLLLVIGDREVEQRQVAVRTLSGKDLGSMSVETFAERLQTAVVSRGLNF